MNWTDGNVLTIQTPEGVTFRLPLAGPVTRMLVSLYVGSSDFKRYRSYWPKFTTATGKPGSRLLRGNRHADLLRHQLTLFDGG